MSDESKTTETILDPPAELSNKIFWNFRPPDFRVLQTLKVYH